MKCHRFDSCSAPICPIDPEMKRRTYSKGEAICRLMLESVKPDAELIFQGTIGVLHFQAITEAAEWAKSAHSSLKRRLEHASRTPSRLGGCREV